MSYPQQKLDANTYFLTCISATSLEFPSKSWHVFNANEKANIPTETKIAGS